MERRVFVQCGGEEVSMTNVLADANSEEYVNELLSTEVLEAMVQTKLGRK